MSEIHGVWRHSQGPQHSKHATAPPPPQSKSWTSVSYDCKAMNTIQSTPNTSFWSATKSW